MLWKSTRKKWVAFVICSIFFIAYTTLAIVRHNHYESYGFDLGISDQITWKYSIFHDPITTVHYYPFTSILTDHVEFIYALLSIFYWIWSDPRMLLILQAAFVCFSAIPMYLLAKDKKIKPFIAYIIMISYMTFYGIQNALWFDVHSAAFGTSFLAWFIYFLHKKNWLWSSIFFTLAIISKENIALLTCLISVVFFIKRRGKKELLFIALSALYIFIIFGIYFPHFTKGYGYQEEGGLLSNVQIVNLFNTHNKQEVFWVSLGWFGFLPLLLPLYLIPFLGDLFSYFVVANQLKEADSIFMHYRITLAPLLTWAVIMTIAYYKYLNKWYTGVYLLLALLFFQYMFHLPLSYLAKSWFWTEPAAVKDINAVIANVPHDASVVSQNNITPHIAHRKEIFTLWPKKKTFATNSSCGKKECNWFTWGGNPKYLIVDTSANWDIRHLLANREEYIEGLATIEKSGYIKKEKQHGNTVLYKILKKPN